MIETHYQDDTKLVVFDEPIPEYWDLLLQAATENNNKLRNNYRENILKDHLFMTIYYVDDKPAEMFGLMHTSDMGRSARGFNRLYKAPEFRTVHTYRKDLTNYYNRVLHGTKIFNFYRHFPQYIEAHNIDTIFFTRNFRSHRNDMHLADRLRDEWKTNFIPYDGVYLFKGVPQKFYYDGPSDQFFSTLPIHDA